MTIKPRVKRFILATLTAVCAVLGGPLLPLDTTVAQSRSNAAQPAGPKAWPGIGEFDTFFTERSPLSRKDELTRRLVFRPEQTAAMKDPAGDTYDVTKQSFRIYVPDDYKAGVPHGVIYYLGYKDATQIPSAWKETLKQQHLIYITPRSIARPEWQHAAVALDAIEGLKKQYTIDTKRIYLFEFPDRPGLIGLQMGLGLPDVFTGVVHINRLEHYKAVAIPERRVAYPAALGQPPNDLLAMSKRLPHAFVLQNSVFAAQNGLDKRTYFEPALKRDGFTQTLFISIADPEELHYPNFRGPWLGQVLEWLGNAAPKAPSSRPAS